MLILQHNRGDVGHSSMPFGLSKLSDHFPSLNVKIKGKDSFEVVGDIYVNARWGEFIVAEWFSIKIIAVNFPQLPPVCIETSGKVINYHVNPKKDLCLGSPRVLYEEIAAHPDIIFYINKFIIPFFFSFRYHQQYGISPFGELEHGGDGLFPIYRRMFKTSDLVICTLLTYGTKILYRGHHPCPCGSGLRLRKCHGPRLRALFEDYHPALLLTELENCARSLKIRNREHQVTLFKERYVKAINILKIFAKAHGKAYRE